MRSCPPLAIAMTLVFVTLFPQALRANAMNDRFDQLSTDYINQFPALSPVSATMLGDHRFDGQLDDVSAQGRTARAELNQRFLNRLQDIPRTALSRDRQVDAALLENQLAYALWRDAELQEWAWNPLVYTQLTGNALYGLMARNFAPIAQRLQHATARLQAMPALFEQIRETLQPKRVPKVHAETALRQNRGLLSDRKSVV